jgi:hypothetical protein
MPGSQRAAPTARTLDLPPPFRPVVLRERGDAFVHACAHAAELGAGTLVFVGRFDAAEFAVVLEPEEPLLAARRAFYACMVALGDTLAACAPPEKPIAIEWPDAFHVDGGRVGGGRLGWPDGSDEGSVPDWLVFGAIIRTAWLRPAEAGLHPLETALSEEGFDDAGPERIAERFSRHLMAATDRWQEVGFEPIAKNYLARLTPESEAACREIGANGDIHLLRSGQPVATRLLAVALQAPSWLDVAPQPSSALP